MSALGRFEEFIEGLVEKPFAVFQRGHVQPVEIAKRLARAMETEQTLGVDKTFVPNDYHVFLSPTDFAYFADMRLSMERELGEYLLGVARERHFSLLNRPLVVIAPSDEVDPRQIRVLAKFSDSVPAPSPTANDAGPAEQHTYRLDTHQIAQAVKELAQRATLVMRNGANAGASLPVNKSTVTIGRALDNDIVLEDQRVSRYHAEIKLKAGRFCLRDLHSSNGTQVNGQPVVEALLEDGDMIAAGDTELVFETKREQTS